jgi:hypothetical protein
MVAILVKELKEMMRDGRIKIVAIISLILLVISSITGINQYQKKINSTPNRPRKSVLFGRHKRKKIHIPQRIMEPMCLNQNLPYRYLIME